MFVLSKDGKVILKGTYYACLDKLMKIQPFSSEFARYQGYEIKEIINDK